jgi:hypothetical protein
MFQSVSSCPGAWIVRASYPGAVVVPGFGRFHDPGAETGHRRRGAGWHDIEDDAVGAFARSIGIVDLALGINPPVNLGSTQYGGRKREAEEHD